ncbi:MAG: KEOPS complex subunit Cgi121 [Thermoplasmata archaeon]
MGCFVLGARGEVRDVQQFIRRLRQVAQDLGLEGQAFDADLVFGAEHLLVAWDHAERAFSRGSNVASDRMVEVLLFAAGERQIAKALEKMGVKEGQDHMVLLLAGEGDPDRLLTKLGLERDDRLLEGRVDMLPAFGFTKEEMATVDTDRVFDLVLERVALVGLLR